MSRLSRRESEALDRHITGNYGEDQQREENCEHCGFPIPDHPILFDTITDEKRERWGREPEAPCNLVYGDSEPTPLPFRMSRLSRRESEALDRHTTGNYGEDQQREENCEHCGFPIPDHPILFDTITDEKRERWGREPEAPCNLVYGDSEPTPLPFSELHSLDENDKLEWQAYWQDKFIMPDR